MVTGVAKAWVRTGHQLPLEQRWEEAVARLQKLSPGATVGGPMTELSLDAITEQINRLAKPVDLDDPALRAASAEMNSTEERYHRAWCDARSLQERMRRYAKSDVSRLLGNLPDELFADVGPPIDMGVHPWPRFRSAREARVAVAEFLPKVLELESRVARLVDASRTAAEPDEVLNRKMILKLWDRVQELESKIEQLQAPTATARDPAIAAIAANPQKSDRAIADELGIGKDSVRRARKFTGAT
jgi:hypothetical protein